MSESLEIGIDSFGDVTARADGTLKRWDEVIRDVVDEGSLADQVGLDFMGVGEHHRSDFAISAPDVVLAALASRTQSIRLGSAVTVLSSDDPVRVFERFSTLDAISQGRAEVMLGRGSFIESFPLFGYDLDDYEALFDEKLDLFAEILKEKPVTWSGTMRASLTNQEIYPPTASGSLRTWIAVGGSPESVIRAARYDMPLFVAIIGGEPIRFKPLIDLYREALTKLGKPQLPVAIHSPGHVATTDEQAKEELWPHYLAFNTKLGRERGWAPPNRQRFEREAAPEGSLVVGSPETVATKIARMTKELGISRFDLRYSNGKMEHSQLMRSVELLGTKVKPLVEELLSE